MSRFKDYIDETTVTGDVATNTTATSGEDNLIKKRNKKTMKKHLGEATILGGGGQAGDDDTPPGNIVMGLKFKKEKVKNSLTGEYTRQVIDNDPFYWDEFDNSAGMEDPNRYSDTLRKKWRRTPKKYDLDDTVPNYVERFHKHIKKRDIPDATIAHKTSQDKVSYWGTIAFTGNPRPFLKYVDGKQSLKEDRQIHINISDDRAGDLLKKIQSIYNDRGIQVTHNFVNGFMTLPDHLYDEVLDRLSNSSWIEVVKDET
jgi:hypothetical protein